MEITINLKADTATVEGVITPLDYLRKFMLTHYSDLCAKSFIKAIKIPGGTRFTYDWDYIFYVAKSPMISLEYWKYCTGYYKKTLNDFRSN